jgi:oxalate decarboxylase/phosphoglucose isomerase-like protein (cupin superfamily)
MAEGKLTFVEKEDVETQVFDWGRLWWLSEPKVTAAERFSTGLVVLEPGKGHARHNHPYSEEILYVISGTGLQTVEGNGPDGPNRIVEREVGPGTLVHIPTALFHSTVNTGDKPMELIAIYAPFGPEAELRELDGVAIEPPARTLVS